MTSSLLLALAVTSSTSTAATYQRAAVGWEVAAEDTLGALDEAQARLAAEVARVSALRTELGLAKAQAREREAALGLDLLEAQQQAAERVSRGSRTWSVVGGAACAAGAVAAVLGLALCEGSECRQVLGLGGGALAVGGCVTTVIAW